LQAAQFLDETAIGLAQVLPAERVARSGVVEGKARHRVAALVAEEIRPLALVGRLGADDENPPAVGGALLDLLAEPFELVAAPARLQVTLRHDEHQHARGADLGAQRLGQVRGRVFVLIDPEI
jgi:hypothetical protein